jgi:hypothetical protein
VGEWLVGAAGVTLVVSLFLPWFEDPVNLSGWEAFAVTDVIAAVIAAGALGLVVVTARFRSASPAIAYEAMLTLIAALGFAIVAIRLLSPPGELTGLGVGAWLGLLASAGVVVASTVAMRDERPSRPGRPTDSGGVPVTAPREVETIPSPPATSS